MPEPDPSIHRYRQLPPGIRTNRVLYDLLLQPRFLGYWTFLEPSHDGVELADVLMICGDTALLFEAKTRGVPRPASPAWLRTRLSEAVDQLNARAATLQGGQVRLRNSWRGSLLFDPNRIRHIYGIVTLVASFDPFEWRDVARSAAKRTQIPVQVYSLFDFSELLRIFDTPNDLLIYYEMRAIHGQHHRMLAGKEEKTFREVLETWSHLWKGDPEDGEEIQEYFVDLANAVLRTPAATEKGFRAWATSRLIDLALRPADKKADTDSSGRRVGGPDHDVYLAALEAIAEMSRTRRSHYGGRWLAASEEAITEARLAFRISHSPSRQRSYVLAATPLGKSPSEEEMAQLGLRAMHEHQTESCLVLGASAASIRTTFQFLLGTIRREDPDLPGELALAPIIAWIGPRAPE